MADYRVVLRELATDQEIVRMVKVPYDGAVLCAALGGYAWPFTRADVRHARRMAGVYPTKPHDQRCQLVRIERTDDPFAKPSGFRKTQVPKGPAGDMDKFLIERNDHE